MLSLLVAAIASASPVYVQATSLHLRATPGGDRVATVPIHTALEVLERSDDQVLVRLIGRPPGHPVIGWVPSDFVSETMPDVGQMVAAADQSVSGEDESMWLDRALALTPNDASLRTRRASLAIEGGDAETAERMAGSEPIYVGYCDGSRAMLWARVDDGAVTPMTFFGHSKAQRVAVEMAGLSWHGGVDVFATPFPTDATNELYPNAYLPGENGLGQPVDEREFNVVLGPCSWQGYVATASIGTSWPDLASHKERDVATVSALTDRAIVGHRVTRPVHDLPLSEVVLDVLAPEQSCGGEDWPLIVQKRVALLGDDGTVLNANGLGNLPEGGDSTWLRFGDRYLGLYRNHTDVHVALWDGTKLVSRSVGLRYDGC